ncbi:hypothetical protein K2X05_14720, partial [bacterium]|nr:hypothetical protein [bacterium]
GSHATAPQNSVQTQVTQTTTVSETKSMSLNAAAPANNWITQLDAQSLQAIRSVQERFNLSSPQEALRMIISVGSKQISHWP